MPYRRSQWRSLKPITILIGINALVFVATTIDRQLIHTLGLQPDSFSERPWTIVTNLFTHGSLLHVATNMFTLYFFGTYLSMLVGQRSFLIVYFLGGMWGNILYLILADPSSIGIGASGAVFAVAGALTAMRPKLKVMVFPIPIPLPLWVAIIGGFFVLSLFPNVAWQAHLGGLIFGLAAGYFFRKRGRRFLYY